MARSSAIRVTSTIEIDVARLEEISETVPDRASPVRGGVHRRRQANALLGQGRLINLAAAEGHPASVMDMSFANQALAAEYLLSEEGRAFSKQVHRVPAVLDREIARLKLASMDIGYRYPDPGAGTVPELLGRGNLIRSDRH